MTAVVLDQATEQDVALCTDPVLLDAYAVSERTEIRVEVARHPLTSVGSRKRLARDAAYGVRQAVYDAPISAFTDEFIDFLIESSRSPYDLAQLARMPGLPLKYEKQMAKHKEYYIRSLIAKKTSDEELLDTLIKDRTVSVRRAVAYNSNHSMKHREILAADKNGYIRCHIASMRIREEIQFALAKDKEREVRAAMARSIHLATPVEEYLVDQADSWIDWSLIVNRTSSARSIRIIFDRIDDSDYRFMERVLQRSEVPLAERARKAAYSRSVRVRNFFFKSLTPAEISELASSDDEKVRILASKQLVKTVLI